jgi:hypothetical protein
MYKTPGGSSSSEDLGFTPASINMTPYYLLTKSSSDSEALLYTTVYYANQNLKAYDMLKF